MAIAYDSGNKYTACVTGTSCTYSFTNTAGNFVGNASIGWTTNPGTVSMTYGGASMTKIGSTLHEATADAYVYTFYKANAATGTNNLTTTTTNSLTGGFYDHAISYSGTHASAPVANATQATTGNIGNTSIAVTIGDTSNSYAVWLGLGGGRGRAYTAGSNTTLRSAASDAQTYVFDSGGIANSSPWTLNATISSGTEEKYNTAFELVVAAAGGSSSIKTINGLTLASVKTVNGLATASVKTVNGLA